MVHRQEYQILKLGSMLGWGSARGRKYLADADAERKCEIPILRNHPDQTLEVHDGIVSRLIEQGERLKGDEKCPKCGQYNLELKILLDEIGKLSKLQNEVTKRSIQRMKELDKART